MRLAIIHHHLNRGGVSQVIGNHLRSLAALPDEDHPESVALLFDGQADGWPEDPLQGEKAFPISKILLKGIGYDKEDSTVDSLGLANQIEEGLTKASYSTNETILHWHNHSLGKNASVPGAISILAQRGWKQLLQVHDFAEDNRPLNYLHLQNKLGATEVASQLYPQSENIHYATLTERDAAVLIDAEVPTARLTTLPNPVLPFASLPDQAEVRKTVFDKLSISSSDARLLTYPVRGIRRKNVGEILLLAALSKQLSSDNYFAITLAPKNPTEYQSFEHWQKLADRLELPCRFDTGGTYGVDFLDLLTASDAILTTSIAEGFGMVFMEAWLLQKPLIGRDLPDITADFKKSGMDLSSLYPELAIPTELLDLESIITSLTESYLSLRKSYQLDEEPADSIRRQYEELVSGGTIDFARLPSNYQQNVIEMAISDVSVSHQIIQLNEGLNTFWQNEFKHDHEVIIKNQQTVLSEYSEVAIAKRLKTTYDKLLETEPCSAVNAGNGNRVLNWFVTPEKIIPIRIES